MSGTLLAQSEYCGEGTVWDAESQTCIVAESLEFLDFNLDGLIGVEDLLNLLSHFGDQDMDFDGIYDSVDDCIGFFDPCGVCNGDGLDLDLDGICDEWDECVGYFDECGICNGPGPQVIGIDTILVLYDSIYNPQTETWNIEEIGADTLLTLYCEYSGCMDSGADNFDPYAQEEDGSCLYNGASAACDFQSALYYNNHYYDLIAIGGQCWFAENLRTHMYADGDSIPIANSIEQWSSDPYGAIGSPNLLFNQSVTPYCGLPPEAPEYYAEYCSPEGGNNAFNTSMFEDDFGLFYNQYAVMNEKNLCPNGWRIPRQSDVVKLEIIAEEELGASFKVTDSHLPPWNGSNSSGFSGTPGGYLLNGAFDWYLDGNAIGLEGRWWKILPCGASAFKIYDATGSNTNDFRVNAYWGGPGTNADGRGHHVRCVKGEGGCNNPLASNYSGFETTTEDGNLECEFLFDCTQGQTLNYFGHSYDLTEINGRCWFAENLQTEYYANGDLIAQNLSDWQWAEFESGAQSVFGEGTSPCCNSDYDDDGVFYYDADYDHDDQCNEDFNLENFGRLYNWHATSDERGLCPSGWHVPTETEYDELFDYVVDLGFDNTALSIDNICSHHLPFSDPFGFSSIGGGFRGVNGDQLGADCDEDSTGGFCELFNQGLWSSSISSDSNCPQGIAFYEWSSDYWSKTELNVNVGLSIRCIQDE